MRSLWQPSRGGWLSMLNAAGTVACMASLLGWQSLQRWDLEWLGVAAVCLLAVLSLPIAWWWLVPTLDYMPTTLDIVEMCAVVGLNSFLWGYGVDWLMTRRQRKLPPDFAVPSVDSMTQI
jgi:hypothetical protein